MRMLAVACAIVPIVALGAPAQDSSSVTEQVRAFVTKYTDAANSGDVSAYAAMYEQSPSLITINDGRIRRGWDSIRDEANQLLGVQGRYKLSAGIVDVLRLGPRSAVATFPFVLTYQAQQGQVQINGAATLVLARSRDHWRIVQDHWSSLRPPATGSP